MMEVRSKPPAQREFMQQEHAWCRVIGLRSLVQKRSGQSAPLPELAAYVTQAPVLLFALCVVAAFVAYTFVYLGTDALPGNPVAPIGWWGWFDQGQYIESARAFADGTWRTYDHFYPPLYPWLGSFFVRLWPGHPFFLIDFMGWTLHLASLVVVGRLLFGRTIAMLTTVATFALWPVLTILQWEIPWTTSLSSGIGATMLLVFARFSMRSWAVTSRSDWGLIALNSVAFGSMGAVRPLDAVVWLPAALVFYASIALRNTNFTHADVSVGRALRIGAVIVICGLLAPVLYLYFNVATSGSVLGTYIIKNSSNGYQLHGFTRKLISIMFDSETVYVESGQAIANWFWPIYLGLPLLFIGFASGAMLLRVLTITIGLQFLIYIPYGDLLPNGMFRYYNIHYFAWTFPWLTMICVGYVQTLFSRAQRRRFGWFPHAAVATLTIVSLLVSLRSYPVGTTTANAIDEHKIAVELNAQQGVDFVDIAGATGSWPDIFFGKHALEIDGRPLRVFADFRLVPVQHGLRLILPRTMVGQRFELTLDPKIAIEPSALSARAVGVAPSLLCRLKDCGLLPLAVPSHLIAGPLTVNFAGTGPDPYLAEGWSGPEDWGRWSDSEDARLAFRVGAPRALSVEADVRPLLSKARSEQDVSIVVNGCPVARTTFSFPYDAVARTIGGEVPSSCIPDDGHVDVDIMTDHARSPKSVGISEDDRALGVGVQSLTLK